jgi:hypothetical protein
MNNNIVELGGNNVLETGEFFRKIFHSSQTDQTIINIPEDNDLAVVGEILREELKKFRLTNKKVKLNIDFAGTFKDNQNLDSLRKILKYYDF